MHCCWTITIFTNTDTGKLHHFYQPLLHDFQRETQQLPLALLPPLDHLQDGDGSAQVTTQLQHLLV